MDEITESTGRVISTKESRGKVYLVSIKKDNGEVLHLKPIVELAKMEWMGTNYLRSVKSGAYIKFKYNISLKELVFVNILEESKMALELVKEKVEPSRERTIVRQNALSQANALFQGKSVSEKEFFEFAEKCENWVFR